MVLHIEYLATHAAASPFCQHRGHQEEPTNSPMQGTTTSRFRATARLSQSIAHCSQHYFSMTPLTLLSRCTRRFSRFSPSRFPSARALDAASWNRCSNGVALYGTRIRFLSISDPIIFFFWTKMFIFFREADAPAVRAPARQSYRCSP